MASNPILCCSEFSAWEIVPFFLLQRLGILPFQFLKAFAFYVVKYCLRCGVVFCCVFLQSQRNCLGPVFSRRCWIKDELNSGEDTVGFQVQIFTNFPWCFPLCCVRSRKNRSLVKIGCGFVFRLRGWKSGGPRVLATFGAVFVVRQTPPADCSASMCASPGICSHTHTLAWEPYCIAFAALLLFCPDKGDTGITQTLSIVIYILAFCIAGGSRLFRKKQYQAKILRFRQILN